MKNTEFNYKKKKSFGTILISYFFLYSFLFQILYTPLYALTVPKIIIQNDYPLLSHQYVVNEQEIGSNQQVSNTFSKKEKIDKIEKEVTSVQIIEAFADIQMGYIGDSKGTSLDDPKDNIFKIHLQNIENSNSAFLVYDVYGVDSESSVVKSINQETSTGGFLVKKNNNWVTIKEQVDIESLKNGLNTVLFTTPSLEKVSYQVKDVKIELHNKKYIKDLSLDNTDGVFLVNENKAYIKGHFSNDNDLSSILVNGQVVEFKRDKFEGVIEFDKTNFKKLDVQLIKKSGQTTSKSFPVNKLISTDFYFNHANLEAKNSFNVNEKANFLDSKETFLDISELALNKNVVIEVQPLRSKDVAPTSSNIINVTKHSKGYRYLPDGLIFEKNVKLGISYDKNLIPKGYSEKDVKIFFFDIKSKEWKSIPTDSIDNTKQQIVSLTNHFTDYIAGIIKSPESPETNLFKPSSIQDIEIANPATGINEIQVPEANQQGDASLNYAFELPTSKNGIKPSLGIQYNNNGGNGWLGQGWDLSIPSIDVDTRWGVPRFHVESETESYLMSGEELMLYQDATSNYLPHAKPLISRLGSEVNFVKSVEGEFNNISRIGTNPSNYSWIVLDKHGNKFYYGSTANSRLTTGSGSTGNIARWMLDKVEDRNGNYTTYTYELVTYTEGALSGGKQLFISNIRYSQNDRLNTYDHGFYNVNFYRKKTIDNPSSTFRNDKAISNRYGFKEITYDLLDKVVISPYEKTLPEYFTNEYHFNYVKGQFDKTLLDKVINVHTYQNKPSISYEHKFSYYNDVADGKIFENSEIVISTENDYEGTFEDKNIEPTLLGGGNGKFKSFNVGMSFGTVFPIFPASYLPFSRSLTLGGSYTKTDTDNDTKTALIDIDGDGLPDKVYKTTRRGNHKLYFRKNLGTTFSFIEKSLPDNFDLGHSDGVSSSKNANANVFLISAAYSESEANTNITKYLHDVNNDGLIDLVDNTNVYFSYIDPTTILPVFTNDSSKTPNIIMKEEDMAPILNQMPELSLKNDLMDIVRVWEAPIAGTINISGVISVQHTGLENGIRYSIEHAKPNSFVINPFGSLVQDEVVQETNNVLNTTFFRRKIDYIKEPALMLTASELTNFNQITVRKGDQIFFRVANSQIPTVDPQVTWNPNIQYTTTNFDSPNGFKKYSSSYNDAFLLSENNEFQISKNGVYTLNWDNFNINNTGINSELSDNVFVKVSYYKYDTTLANSVPQKRNPIDNSTNILIYNSLLRYDANNSSSNQGIVLNAQNVSENDPSTYQFLKVELVSDTEVNWNILQEKFKPKIFNSTENQTTHLPFSMSNYPNIHTNYYHSNFSTNSSKNINIKHDFVLPSCVGNTCQDQYVYLVAKTPNGKIVKIGTRPLKFRFKINPNGNVIEKLQENGLGLYTAPANYTLTTQLQQIYFEMYTETKSMANRLVSYQQNNDFITLSTGEATKSTYSSIAGADNTGLFKVNIYSKENLKGFGPMFRNWGQFAYKGANPGEPMQKINLKNLRFVDNYSGTAADETIIPGGQSMEQFFSDPNAAQNSISPDGQSLNMDFMTGLVNSDSPFLYFQPLNTDMNNKRWKSHNKLYVTRSNISPYTRFEDQGYTPLTVPVYHNSPYGATAIRKEIRTEGTNYNIGASTIYGSVTPSTSKGTTKSYNDYRDINGDGYPDILGSKVQLTSGRGGLSNIFINKDLNYESSYNGYGLASSGTPGTQKKDNVPIGKGKTMNIMYMDSNSGLSPSVGSDAFKNVDEENKFLIDINGDGLPDFLDKNGTVELNYGYRFEQLTNSQWTTNFASKTIGISHSINAGLGGAVLSNFDLSIGGSLGVSENEANSTYIDINGDGLVDKLINGNEIFFNTGTSFTANSSNLPGKQVSIGGNGGLNGNGTVSVNVPIAFGIGPKFSIYLGGNVGENITLTRSSFVDFDGDGYVDFLSSNNDNHLSVRYSKINRTNMLKSVTRPLGAVITLDYSKKNSTTNETLGSTYKMPFKKWVLSNVQVFDGHVGDGVDVQKIAFEYKDGYKDRKKRKFLGFGEVQTHQLKEDNSVYRTSVSEYFIKNIPNEHLYQRGDAPDLRQYYFKKDLPTREYLIDENHRIHSEKIYSYSFFRPNYSANYYYDTTTSDNAYYSDTSIVLPLLKSVKSVSRNFNEETTDGSFEQVNEVQFNAYDKYGNVTNYREELEHIDVEINYHYLSDINYYTSPETHRVYVGSLQRESITELDDYGNVTSIKRFLDDNNYSETNMEYDIYGNITKVILPRPEMSSPDSHRMFYEYTYNEHFVNNIIKTKDAYGYESTSEYNSLGQPTVVKDMNSNTFNYTYDALGRLTTFKGPYNNDWTIKNEYHFGIGFKPYALTSHNLVNPLFPSNSNVVTTSTMIDGLGRVIQTKKQLQNENNCNGFNYVVSGLINYDEFGRSVSSFLSQNIQNCNANAADLSNFLGTYSILPHVDQEKTIVAYNYKDQPLYTKILGLNAVTNFAYSFDHDAFGNVRFTEKVQLPEGNISIQFKDEKGRVTTSRQVGNGQVLDTKYYYDGLSQIRRVEDAESKSTTYRYNNFGQLIFKEHPDFGIHKYNYDLSGKLVSEQNANLINSGQQIRYKYNFNQLIEVAYPSHNVYYDYGYPGGEANSNGRLVYQQDLTGNQTFKYGALGEIKETERIINSVNGETKFFNTKFTYDSWGKTYQIIYPDNEVVNYEYNNVGQLIRVFNDEDFIYLRDVKYNFFDQPTKITYGNGTVNYNEYDITQRLRAQQVDSSEDGILMRNIYSYDRNQNIISIANEHSLADQLQIGGIFIKKYEYDGFNRLSKAYGNWNGYEEAHEYDLNMEYNATHGISVKNQKHISTSFGNTSHSDNSYSNRYSYGSGHQVSSIESTHDLYGGGNLDFKYDSNGNITDLYSNIPLYPEHRNFIWDEQNRLIGVVDDTNSASQYIYDASGERVLKRDADASSIDINGSAIFNIIDLDQYTIYPNSFLVVNNAEYTKHYYINSKRFASRIGNLDNVEYFNNPSNIQAISQQNEVVQSDNSIKKVLSVNSQAEIITINTLSGNEINCQNQINVLLNLDYPTTNPARLHCREEILAIINENDTCAALILINELSCIERDPVTGYPINQDGQIINPFTGYPIGQGPGEGTNDPDPQLPQEQIECMQEVQEYYSYTQYFYINYIPHADFLYDPRYEIYRQTMTWAEFHDLFNENPQAADCFKHLDDYISRTYSSGDIDFCDVLEYIKTLPCPLLDEVEPVKPTNPGEIQAPGGTTDDDWNDLPIEEPGVGVLLPEPEPIWWYHTDHLGSSSYITDNFGRPSHYYDQLPFGESMVEHNQSSYYNNGYKFNGKELDEATGMYYYGARYYDPRISIFISVDPLAEQTMTPYQYVHNNPIMFTDPTGMSAEGPGDECGEGGGNPRKGATRPAGMSESEALSHTTTVDGKKYHTYTSNIFASVGNAINSLFGGDNDYFVEKKPFDPATDKMLKEFINEGSSMVLGAKIFQLIKPLGTPIKGAFTNIFAKGGDDVLSAMSGFAKKNNIYSTNIRGLNNNIVDKYYNQMINNSFDSYSAAVFVHGEKVIMSEGNHRMAAAIKYALKTGDTSIAEKILKTARVTKGSPSNYGLPTNNLIR